MHSVRLLVPNISSSVEQSPSRTIWSFCSDVWCPFILRWYRRPDLMYIVSWPFVKAHSISHTQYKAGFTRVAHYGCSIIKILFFQSEFVNVLGQKTLTFKIGFIGLFTLYKWWLSTYSTIRYTEFIQSSMIINQTFQGN